MNFHETWDTALIRYCYSGCKIRLDLLPNIGCHFDLIIDLWELLVAILWDFGTVLNVTDKHSKVEFDLWCNMAVMLTEFWIFKHIVRLSWKLNFLAFPMLLTKMAMSKIDIQSNTTAITVLILHFECLQHDFHQF